MPSVVAPASGSPTTKRYQLGGKCGDRKTTFTERPSVMAVSFRDARQIWRTATIGSDSESPAMKIALVAPPCYPSHPPLRRGGADLGVLADGLLQRGHDVTLFAPGDSRFGGRLVPTVPSGLWNDGFPPDPSPYFRSTVEQVLSMATKFDLIHNHLDFTASAWPRNPTFPWSAPFTVEPMSSPWRAPSAVIRACR